LLSPGQSWLGQDHTSVTLILVYGDEEDSCYGKIGVRAREALDAKGVLAR
jgi:hypothetical protein